MLEFCRVDKAPSCKDCVTKYWLEALDIFKYFLLIYSFYVLSFRHVFPTLHQRHQHILQPITVQKSAGPVPKSATVTTTAATAGPATAVHQFPRTTATATTNSAVWKFTANIQLPRLQKQSNIPARLSADQIPTGKQTILLQLLFNDDAEVDFYSTLNYFITNFSVQLVQD